MFPSNNRSSDEPFTRETRFAAERVEMVIKAFHLDAYRDAMYETEAAGGGDRVLTFGAFDAVLETFPVWLAAKYERGPGKSDPAMLFRSLTDGLLRDFYRQTRLVTAIERRGKAAGPDPRPFALVLPLASYPGGFVLHDADLPTTAARWVADFAAGPPYRLTFEPFRGFLSRLARTGWAPGRAAWRRPPPRPLPWPGSRTRPGLCWSRAEPSSSGSSGSSDRRRPKTAGSSAWSMLKPGG